jgi:hypothetical protein
LEELARQTELVAWLHKALEGMASSGQPVHGLAWVLPAAPAGQLLAVRVPLTGGMFYSDGVSLLCHSPLAVNS